MGKLEDAIQSLIVSPEARHTISRILSRLDEPLLKSWLDKLQIKEGRVFSTFYSELGSRLSFNDFVALYQALDYDFNKMSLWQDWRCYGAEGCKREAGWTCDPDRCP